MYIADLHIHSHYSRATSRDCNLENLDLWARRKGIQIVGSGDFTHPAWREEMMEKLEPAEEGLYLLKDEYRIHDDSVADVMLPRFVITGEISSIYKKYDRVRKVHSLLLLPSLEDAELLAKKLEAIGNIHSDGRPILGIDCHDLLEIMLEICPGAVYVPAHIWTPHFSLFGAFSGFDSVEECFGDLSGHIHAMETGLSSDPPMIWRVSALDKYQLISNSDAHSPAKLGREANLLDIELSFWGLRSAIQEGRGLYGTIEFFPEEGKYHFDGHRKCGICLNPVETKKYGGICPVCGRKLTIGVSHRIEQLADREDGFVLKEGKPFESLVPLPEVIGASVGATAASAKVQKEYQKMLKKLGPEFEILRNIPTEEIQSVSGHLVAEGIRRLRSGEVERLPGFDGEYGTIKFFTQEDLDSLDGQMNFFEALHIEPQQKKEPHDKVQQNIVQQNIVQQNIVQQNIVQQNIAHQNKDQQNSTQLNRKVSQKSTESSKTLQNASQPNDAQQNAESHTEVQNIPNRPVSLNEMQEQAVRSVERTIAVIAGPGTGKTKTLISHLLYLLEVRKVKPSEITAVTFTNQAAGEMRERVKKQLGRARNVSQLQIGTFHAVCLNFLKNQGIEFSLADDVTMLEAARIVTEQIDLGLKPKQFLKLVSLEKSGAAVKSEEFSQLESNGKEWKQAVQFYQQILQEQSMMDFDDLLLETLWMIEQKKAAPGWEKSFSYLLVDEFQDISPVQYRLIQVWNQEGRELFVIGDPDQSIYGFRGSDAACFTKLTEDYPDLHEIRLTENYRCTPSIVNAATAMISHNPGDRRVLNAHKEESVPVRLVQAGTEMGEAIFIAKEINKLTGGIGMLDAQEFGVGNRQNRGFGEIAILYRTHRQADLLEKCLRTEGIPYVTAGREDFLMEDAVRGSIAFFKVLADPEDEFSEKICLKLLWKLDKNVVAEGVFDAIYEKFKPLYRKNKPQKFLETWMKEMELEENTAMKKLAGMTVFYKTMSEFVEALSLGVESDLKRCGSKKYTGEAVTLMTLHGAKGLEFPVTFIYGLRKGIIPFEKEDEVNLEEERRLFFVGMTRAQEELILTTSGEESEFIEELPEESIMREKADKRKNADSGKQMSLFDYM